jgi:small subunit ribosomal protein S6
MRRYEVVFVLAPTLTEEEVDSQVDTFAEAAQEMGAEVANIDKWGKRRLAFPVQKHNEGYYTVLTLDEESGRAVAELERRFKVIDAVIRFLSVRVDEDLKRAQKFETRKEQRQLRRAQSKATSERTPADSDRDEGDSDSDEQE